MCNPRTTYASLNATPREFVRCPRSKRLSPTMVTFLPDYHRAFPCRSMEVVNSVAKTSLKRIRFPERMTKARRGHPPAHLDNVRRGSLKPNAHGVDLARQQAYILVRAHDHRRTRIKDHRCRRFQNAFRAQLQVFKLHSPVSPHEWIRDRIHPF